MYSNEVEIHIEICREGVEIPKYAKDGDAGMDVCSAVDTIVKPGETVIVPTGLKMAIPKGYEIQVRPRSGISFKTPLRLSNSPGTIDSGYRDEIGIIITNTSESQNFNQQKLLTVDSRENQSGAYKIRKGDRIAQIVLQVVPKMTFTVVDCVEDIGKNRGGGFGSTGVR